MLDQALLSKVSILQTSDLFSNNLENCNLSEKQNIFLVLGGVKPMAFVSSSHKVDHGEMAHELKADDPEFVTTFLKSLGLHCKIFNDEFSTDAIVSLNPSHLEEFEKCNNDPIVSGRLYGYPVTAIEAYASGDKAMRLTEEQQEQVMKEHGIPECFPHFWMSKAHFAEEIRVIKMWYDFCKQYGMV